jgi:hypothetical protein
MLILVQAYRRATNILNVKNSEVSLFPSLFYEALGKALGVLKANGVDMTIIIFIE